MNNVVFNGVAAGRRQMSLNPTPSLLCCFLVYLDLWDDVLFVQFYTLNANIYQNVFYRITLQHVFT